MADQDHTTHTPVRNLPRRTVSSGTECDRGNAGAYAPWLLALRLLAAGLVILALARPVLDAGAALAGRGPLLLVIDNGWASASDWAQRKQAATALLDRAERAGRKAALLATASDGSGSPIAVSAAMPVADLRARLAALQPEPWPPDRAAAVAAIRDWHDRDGASVGYIADGLTDGGDFPAFADALRDVGAVTEICCDTVPPPVLLPPTPEADRPCGPSCAGAAAGAHPCGGSGRKR